MSGLADIGGCFAFSINRARISPLDFGWCVPEAGAFLTKLFILGHLGSITKSGGKHHDSIIGWCILACTLLVSDAPVSIHAIQRVYVVGSDVLCTEYSSRDKILLLELSQNGSPDIVMLWQLSVEPEETASSLRIDIFVIRYAMMSLGFGGTCLLKTPIREDSASLSPTLTIKHIFLCGKLL